MKAFLSFLTDAPKRILLGCGVLYLVGHLVFSYSERSNPIDIDMFEEKISQATYDFYDRDNDQPFRSDQNERGPTSVREGVRNSTLGTHTSTSRASREGPGRSSSDFHDYEDSRGSSSADYLVSAEREREYISQERYGGSFSSAGTTSGDRRGHAESSTGLDSGSRSAQDYGGSFGDFPFNSSSTENNVIGGSSRFTTVGANPGSDQDFNPPICHHDSSGGVYGSSFEVALSCSESAQIYYCVQLGGGCCDPYQSSTVYSSPIEIGPSDDDYCVAYYGVSNQSMLESDTVNVSYTIDSNPPSLLTTHLLSRVQTTQTPIVNFTESTDFGNEDTYFHQINLMNHNPDSLLWNCEDILHNYESLSTPSAIPLALDYDVSGLDTSMQIDQTIGLSDLHYGQNYISTILEDEMRNLYSCQTHLVVLEDFPIFSIPTQGPADTFTDRSFGWFAPYGHFEDVPGSSVGGEGKSLDSGIYLRYEILSITH